MANYDTPDNGGLKTAIEKALEGKTIQDAKSVPVLYDAPYKVRGFDLHEVQGIVTIKLVDQHGIEALIPVPMDALQQIPLGAGVEVSIRPIMQQAPAEA